MITRPMLAAELGFFGPKFPVLATPKIDGFRFLKVGGRALTRSMTPVRNRYVREWIESNLPDGIDGEITVGGSFSEAQSALGSEGFEPDFKLHIFDFVSENLSHPYQKRVADMRAWWESARDRLEMFARILIPTIIHDDEELNAFEEEMIWLGYEGIMLRDPNGPYKCGRSTEAEGYLLKMKRFIDAEAVIVDTFESVNRGELGGFVAIGDQCHEFRMKARGIDNLAQAWADRESYIDRRVKFRYQPVGTTNAPRFPIMVGIRESWDLD